MKAKEFLAAAAAVMIAAVGSGSGYGSCFYF